VYGLMISRNTWPKCQALLCDALRISVVSVESKRRNNRQLSDPVSKSTRGHWSCELTGSVFLYTDNEKIFANKEPGLLYGISAGLPNGSRSSSKLAYVGGRKGKGVRRDTDSVSLGYSIRL
jgi:hypothetical protein